MMSNFIKQALDLPESFGPPGAAPDNPSYLPEPPSMVPMDLPEDEKKPDVGKGRERFPSEPNPGRSVPRDAIPQNPAQPAPLDNQSADDVADVEVMLEFDDQEPICFTLPDVPGAEGADEIIEADDEADIEVAEDEEIEVESDPWRWQDRGLGSFLGWLSEMMQGVPRHSGYDTTGLEKAISYFEALDREISKAMRVDFRNEIDAAQAEAARDEIEQGLERLQARLEKVRSTKYRRHAKKGKNKKSWVESAGLVKEAQKATNITGITVTVPLLISRIARVCINGMVSAGHDIEDLFRKQVELYNLDKREQAEVMQLLADMGYALRQDRGYLTGEGVNQERSDNADWAANYHN